MVMMKEEGEDFTKNEKDFGISLEGSTSTSSSSTTTTTTIKRTHLQGNGAPNHPDHLQMNNNKGSNLDLPLEVVDGADHHRLENQDSQEQEQKQSDDGIINANNPLKIVVVGDGTVGKTCMCIAYTQGVFPDSEYVPTVFENYTGIQEFRDSKYQLALWDTAGQEDYERLRPLSYPGTNVFLLCFSVSNFNSFQNITAKWYPEIKDHAPKVPFVLVGTKSDLRPEDEESAPWYRLKCIDTLSARSNRNLETFITPEMGRKLARKLNAIGYVECSAKNHTGIEDVILEAIKAGIGEEKRKPRCVII